MKKTINDVLKKLNITKPTFYKYFKKHFDLLESYRIKEGGTYFYNDLFIKKLNELILNDKKLTMKSKVKQKKSHEYYIEQIKEQYDNQLNELKNDKINYIKQIDVFQKQLNQKDILLIEKTEKVEKLLLSLVKVINDNKQIENKIERSSEDIIEQVKEKVENQTKLQQEKQKYKDSLKKSNEQLEEYNKYKKEKKELLNNLKNEYNKLKFYNILKKQQLQKKILEISSKDFNFIKYIV